MENTASHKDKNFAINQPKEGINQKQPEGKFETYQELPSLAKGITCIIRTTATENISQNDQLYVKKQNYKQSYGFFIKYFNEVYLITKDTKLNLNKNKTLQVIYPNKVTKSINLMYRKYCLDFQANDAKESGLVIIQMNYDDYIYNYLEVENEYSDLIKKNEESTNVNISLFRYPLINYNKFLNNSISIKQGKSLKIDKDEIIHDINTKDIHLLCPIVNSDTKKIIGLHIKENKNALNINYIINQIQRNILCENIKQLIKLFQEEKESFNINKNLNLIEDIKKDTRIDLTGERIGDEELRLLSKIDYVNLKELYLGQNGITKIEPLINDSFTNLEKLDLAYNQIGDNINLLKEAKFKNLKELYLYGNRISNVDVLANDVFKNLEILDLGYNKIEDNINTLKDAKFMNLKKLNLYNNKISNVDVLINDVFKNLENLYLVGNQIGNNINKLKDAKFKNLTELDLYCNKISNVDVLINSIFKNLEKLYIGGNQIGDNFLLLKDKFMKSRKLNLYEMGIRDVCISNLRKNKMIFSY